MKPKTAIITGSLVLMGAIALIVLSGRGVDAAGSSPPGQYALIAVSNLTDDDSGEVVKANCLYEHLLDDGWDSQNIYYLTPDHPDSSDGVANVSNMEEGFDFLENNAGVEDDVLIYISDHTILNDGVTTFRFCDGNMSSNTVNDHLHNISHNEMTFVMCGNQSGLAGAPLADSGRDIVCSMGECDRYNPDEFNLTRSLKDSDADSNNDGEITFVEASEREIEVMEGYTSQTPRIWYG